MSSIRTDDASYVNSDFDTNDAADALLKMWGNEDAETPSEDNTSDDDTGADESQDDNGNDNDDADAEDNSEETPEDAEDEGEDAVEESEDDKVVVKHKVDGEEKEFTLGHLKRLAGQEATLTRKSQEVAEVRKALDTQRTTQAAQLGVLLDRAKKRFEPFSKINILALAKDPNVSKEELEAVQAEANAAYADYQFLEQQSEQFAQAIRDEQRKELIETARETIKVLSDPKTGIEGWSQQMYGEIRQFATDNGMSADIVNNLVDPAAIKLLNMARLYAKGKAKVSTEKSDAKKAPKRIVKATASAAATKNVTTNAKNGDAMKRLKRSGSAEDAAEALMARWSANSQND